MKNVALLLLLNILWSCTGGGGASVDAFLGLSKKDDNKKIPGSQAIGYDTKTFNEAAINNGSMGNYLTITGTSVTFAASADYVADGKIVVTDVPPGLTARITNVSDTELKFELINNAIAHTSASDTGQSGINNITVQFTDAAFSDGTISSDVIGAKITDGKVKYNLLQISYTPGVFTEAVANNGSMAGGGLVLDLGGDTFTGPNGDYLAGANAGKATITFPTTTPTGLTFTLNKISATQLLLTAVGSATSHANSNDIFDMTVTFNDSAFSTFTAAAITNSTKNNIQIDFKDPPVLTYLSTGYTEAVANTGAAAVTDLVVSLANETFAGVDGEDFTLGGTPRATVTGYPPGMVPSLIRINSTLVKIVLTGNATNHADTDDDFDTTVTFNNGAFTGNNAAIVVDAFKNDIDFDFLDPYTLTYSTATFTESGTNSGIISNTSTITLAGTSFTGANGAFSAAKYIADLATSLPLPSGLTVSMNKVNSTTLTMTLNGPALAHANADDIIANLRITFLNTAFSSGAAAGVTGAVKSNLTVDFNDPATLTYSATTFTEDAINNGTTTSTFDIDLVNDTFNGIDTENFITTSKVVPTNVPVGMTARIVKINNTKLRAYIDGAPAPGSHESGNSVSNIIFTFQNNAFISNSIASNVTNYAKNTIAMNFISTYAQTYTTSTFTEAVANNGTIGNTTTINLTGTTYTGANGVFSAANYSLSNLPNGLTVLVTKVSNTQLTVQLNSNAVTHTNAEDVFTFKIDFNDGAFTSNNAAGVTNATGYNLTIDFKNPAVIAWSATTFSEAATNIGNISNTIVLTLTDETFVGTPGTIFSAGKYTTSTADLTARGLTLSVFQDSATQLTVTLAGPASAHANINDKTDLALTFNNSAFTTYAAATVVDSAKTNLIIDFMDLYGLSYSGTTFNEATANDGTISNKLTLTLSGGTQFADATNTDLYGTKVSVPNAPGTLVPRAIVKSTTTLELDFGSSSTTPHTNGQDISNMIVTFADSAFTTGAAAGVANYTRNDIAVNFNDPAALSYSGGTFNEMASNNGQISNTLVITLINDTFVGANGNFNASVTAASVPSGMTLDVNKDSATQVTLTLNGTAAAHENINDFSNIGLTFNNGAFTNTATASNVVNYSRTDLAVNFLDAYTLTYSGTSFTEALTNNGAVTATRTITIAGSTFAAGTDFISETKASVSGVPTGLTAVLTRTSATVLTLSFTGTASPHDNTADISVVGLTFANSAFTNGNATGVTGYTRSDLSFDFTPLAAITYSSGTFLEAAANNGTIDNTLTLTLVNDTFTGANGAFASFTSASVPTGLTLAINKDSATQLTVSLTGTAAAHANANDISSMVLTFTNAAFTSGTASAVTNYTKTNLTIDYTDTPLPGITSITLPSNGTYLVGQNLNFTVNYNEAVTVTGIPRLTLDIGGQTKYANYVSGSTTANILFTYTMAAGLIDANGIGLTQSIDLNGGTMIGTGAPASRAASLVFTSGSTAAILADDTAPVVQNVIATTVNGSYKQNNVIDIKVTFNEAVTVAGGTPRLLLETGATDRYATYLSGSGSTDLIFRYTVQGGDTSLDLNYNSTSALELNSSTIVDSGSLNAILTLPGLASAFSLGTNNAIIIDSTVPYVTNVDSTTANGSYGLGQSIDVRVTFSEPITVTGTPTITLETGATDRTATYLSGSGSTQLIFRYTTQAGDTSLDLDYVSTSSLNVATSYLPTDISGLKLWLDAQDLTTLYQNSACTTAVAANNDPVGCWRDKSGNTNHSTQGTAGFRPLYKTGAYAKIAFDGTDDLLDAGSSVVSGTLSSFEVLWAGEQYQENGISWTLNNGGTRIQTHSPWSDGSAYFDVGGAGGANRVSAAWGTSNGVLNLWGASNTVAGNFQGLYKNGTVLASDATGHSVVITGNTIIGADTTGDYAQMNVPELLIYDHDLSLAQRQGIEGYLACKYSQQGLLAGGHPFKTTCGDSLRDGAGNIATVTLPNPSLAFSLGANNNIVIDTAPATITNVTSTLANGSYGTGTNVDITVLFTKAVVVSDPAVLQLETGAIDRFATYLSGTGTNTLTFRYIATAGDSAGDLSYKTTTSLLAYTAASWFNASWPNRVKVTIPTTYVTSNLTNFPVYLRLSDLPASFWAGVKSDGGDIRITTSDGATQVPLQLTNFSSGSSVGDVYFKAPSLSSSSATDFYVYYGNSSASQPAANNAFGSQNVWDANTKAVYHLDETSAGTANEMQDSTANAYHMAAPAAGNAPTLLTRASGNAKVGNAQSFDGTNDYFLSGVTANTLGIGGANSKTIMMWGYATDFTANGSRGLWHVGNTGSNGEDFSLRVNAANNNWRVQYWGIDTDLTFASSLNNWGHYAITYDGTNAVVYYNGTAVSTLAKTLVTSNTNAFRIGLWNGNYFQGRVDEASIANTPRSAAWISATYNNENTPASFYTVGTEQDFSFATAGTIKDLSNNTATLTLFSNVTAGSMAVNKAIVIDSIAPSTPTGLSLSVPAASPGNNATPTVLVSGTETGATVAIYSAAGCISLLGSATAAGATTLVTSTSLGADGAYSLYTKQTDAAGNASGCYGPTAYTLDTVIPTVTISVPAASFKASAANYTSYTVSGTCSESGRNVTVTATDGTTPVSTTPACSGGLTYTTNLNLTTLTDTAITITANHSDAAGNAAAQASVAGTKDITVATISSVNAPANAWYVLGQNLNFTVNFTEAVTVSGTRMELNIGGTQVYANYLSGSGSSAIVYRYTVLVNQLDINGIATLGTLDLNAGTISDGTNAATITFTDPVLTGVKVDAVIPTISSVTAPADATYLVTNNMDFTVNFSEAVTITGSPRITLDIGGQTKYATYSSGSPGTAIIFRRTVVGGDVDADGIASSSPITLNGGTIFDPASNVAVLTFTPPTTTGVLVSTTALVTLSPTTFDFGSSIDYTSSNGTYLDINAGANSLARLTNSDQTDDSTAGTGGDLGFQSGGASGTVGVTYNASDKIILNTGGSDTNNAELDQSWTPAWTNILGYWKLNGAVGAIGSGATVTATVGTDGTTVAGNLSYATARMSQGVSGFSATGVINMGDVNAYEGLSQMTIATWVNPTSTAGTTTIVGKEMVFKLQSRTTGVGLLLSLNGSSWACNFDSGTPLVIGSWSYVVGTFDGSTAKIYVNGALYNSCAASGSLGSNGNNFNIGGYGNTNEPFTGVIDDTAYWGTALTIDQINTIYQRQYPKYAGTYVSRIMDGIIAAPTWNAFPFKTSLPFGKEIVASSEAGPVAYWKFDESNGSGTVADSVGSNTGTVNGSLTLGANGKYNTAGNFDGVDDYVEIANSASLNLSTGWTISAWYNPSRAVGTNETIFTSNYTSANVQYALGGMTAGNIAAGLYESGAWKTTATYTPTIGQWVHLTGVYQGGASPYIKLYVNGTLYDTVTAGVPASASTDSAGVRIGRRWDLGNYVGGKIDDVGLWGRALSATEVQNIYSKDVASGSYGTSPTNFSTNLVGHWKFNAASYGTTANEIVDSSGNAKHGQLNTSATTVSGVFGNALEFNATSNTAGRCVTLPVSVGTGLNGASNVTVSMWVRPRGLQYDALSSLFNMNKLAGNTRMRVFMDTTNKLGAMGKSRDGGTSNEFSLGSAMPGGWNHVVAKVTAGTAGTGSVSIWLNGVKTTNAYTFDDNTFQWSDIANVQIGCETTSTRMSRNDIDNVALWSRGLSDSEVQELYKRGVSRVKYQLRTCTASDCSDRTAAAPGWVGYDGTIDTYLSEINNTSDGTPTGTTLASTFNSAFSILGSAYSSFNTWITNENKRYFQYRAILESNDSTGAYKPDISYVKPGPDHYSTTTYSAVNTSTVKIPFVYLTAFSQTLGANGCASGVNYQLSVDGAAWKYWNGSAWAAVSGGTDYNTAAVVNTNIAAFATAFNPTTVANVDLYVKAFLTSSGTSACELDNLTLTGQKY
jgi:hypothetical protein